METKNELEKLEIISDLKNNEILLLKPIQESFHPIAWLQSVGSFLEVSNDLISDIGPNGLESVHTAVNY